MPLHRRFRTFLLLAAAALPLAACAGREAPTADAAGSLYAAGLRDIGNLYLEPLPDRRVALAGASHLSRLDDRLVVADSIGSRFADALTVSYDGRDVAMLPMPSGNEPRQWSGLLDQVVHTAQQVSPRLAAMPQEEIDTAVLRGMTGALDRFSRYSPPELARELRAKRDGFGGVGVTTDDTFRVTAVAAGSPAEHAGIRPEDQIVAIDGMPTAGCKHGDIIHRLRGPIGTQVALKMVRAGTAQDRNLLIRRAYVTLPTVSMTLAGDIAVFKLTGFNQSTASRVAAGLEEAKRRAGGRLAGVVLDLRGNPGGLLDQAVKLADLFIEKGPIVSTAGRNPASHQYFAARGDAIAPHLPVAVLINGGSASASEIVAAALQDHRRGIVIGSSSYGKGTVQTVQPLPNGGELIVTWARLVAPSGYLLQHHGVVPTLCTAALPAGGGDPAVQLQQAAAVAFAAPPRPRAALDEAAWVRLRQSCPPLHSHPPADLQLAERVVGNPRLYAEALGALPTASRFVGAAGTEIADRTP